MKNFEKKALRILLLCLVLCVGVIASCAGDESGGGGGSGASGEPVASNGSADVVDEPAASTGLPPGLPAADMGGKEITLVLLNWHNYEPLSIHDIAVEELTGEGLNDSAFNRNRFLEDSFNCVINTIEFATAGYIPRIRNNIRSGDDTYDIVFFRAITILPLLTGGYLVDFNSIPHVDFDNPWWDRSSMEAMTLGGRVYGALGDHTMTVLKCVWLTYFNKEMVADFALPDPYALVREGRWTFQQMYEMGREVAADLNSDGIMDTNDRWGFIHIDNTATALFNGFGERLINVGADGLPYISVGNPRSIDAFLHITEILSNHDVFLNAHRRTPNPFIYEAGMFVWGQALFSLGGVYYGPEMREMEQMFGLLPYPKFYEGQEWFNPTHSAAIPLLTVPITNSDLENTGLFIEAFTYQGHTNIRPQFYDVMLQRKVARDDESEEMLDFIFSNIVFDIGEAYNFGDIYGQFNGLVSSGNMNIASWLERITTRVERDIEAFVEAMLGY